MKAYWIIILSAQVLPDINCGAREGPIFVTDDEENEQKYICRCLNAKNKKATGWYRTGGKACSPQVQCFNVFKMRTRIWIALLDKYPLRSTTTEDYEYDQNSAWMLNSSKFHFKITRAFVVLSPRPADWAWIKMRLWLLTLGTLSRCIFSLRYPPLMVLHKVFQSVGQGSVRNYVLRWILTRCICRPQHFFYPLIAWLVCNCVPVAVKPLPFNDCIN